jgi:hypothetical protein
MPILSNSWYPIIGKANGKNSKKSSQTTPPIKSLKDLPMVLEDTREADRDLIRESQKRLGFKIMKGQK